MNPEENYLYYKHLTFCQTTQELQEMSENNEKQMTHAMVHFKSKVTLEFEHTFLLPARENFATVQDWKTACGNHIAWCWANNYDIGEIEDYLDHVTAVSCKVSTAKEVRE